MIFHIEQPGKKKQFREHHTYVVLFGAAFCYRRSLNSQNSQSLPPTSPRSYVHCPGRPSIDAAPARQQEQQQESGRADVQFVCFRPLQAAPCLGVGLALLLDSNEGPNAPLACTFAPTSGAPSIIPISYNLIPHLQTPKPLP